MSVASTAIRTERESISMRHRHEFQDFEGVAVVLGAARADVVEMEFQVTAEGYAASDEINVAAAGVHAQVSINDDGQLLSAHAAYPENPLTATYCACGELTASDRWMPENPLQPTFALADVRPTAPLKPETPED